MNKCYFTLPSPGQMTVNNLEYYGVICSNQQLSVAEAPWDTCRIMTIMTVMSAGSVLSDVQNKLVLLALHGPQTEPRYELMAQKLKKKKEMKLL